MEEFLITVLDNLKPAAATGAILVRYLKIQIDKAKKDREAKEKQEIEYRRLQQEMEHATGRYIFWLEHGLEKLDPDHKFFNGELRTAYEEYQSAEKKKKEFEQGIIAKHDF
ncbi:MAG: hypothetical protein IJ410_03565 [Oscillospiraceae bacterium]|nr:hypothetical protein [Oscillospiraceae bacterium]